MFKLENKFFFKFCHISLNKQILLNFIQKQKKTGSSLMKFQEKANFDILNVMLKTSPQIEIRSGLVY